MSVDPAVSSRDLAGAIFDAQLSVPQPRQGTVRRSGLVERLRSVDSRVVGISAPPGYGKTTLLADWASSEDRPVGWLSLRPRDDDPVVLLFALAATLGRLDPESAGLAEEMQGVGVAVLGRAAPLLASAFRASSAAPFVLMLDDLHELRSPECHDVLDLLIAQLPEGCQFAAASRGAQPHIAHYRVKGDAVEVGPMDLRLDADGAQQVFAHVGVVISDDHAGEITTRTEGWPAGVYLAALAASEGQSNSPAPITGDDRYVADYLYQVSLAQLPDDTQDFLLRTSVLQQLSGPLCDAALGSSGSTNRLYQLESSNLFLVPLDRRRIWYRYHSLFREFLLAELHRREQADITTLHERAGDWFEKNGAAELAVDHLLQIPDRDRAVRLVTALCIPTHNAGKLATAQRWLDALGADAIERYPPLAVLAGWEAVLTGRATDAARWASIVERSSFEGEQLDGSASFASARAMFRAVMCANGIEQMEVDARFAVSQEAVGSPLRSAALWLLGEALLLAGDLDRATSVFEEADDTGVKIGNPVVLVACLGELALLAMDRGDWSAASTYVERAFDWIDHDRLYDSMVGLLTFAAAARLEIHRGKKDGALQELGRAMRARPVSNETVPFLAVRLRLQMAKVFTACGDPGSARQLLREIEELLVKRPGLGTLVEQVDDLRGLLAATPMGQVGSAPLSPAELRVLPYLQTHLSFKEIGERLFISRNTVASHSHAIYRKLGVSSRAAAVDRATGFGLIGA